MPRLSVSLLLLLVAALLGGCVGAEPPRLRPVDVAITDASDEAVVLTCALEAVNVAETDLPLVEMHYSVRLAGEPIYRGRHALRQTIPRDGVSRVQIPLVVPYRLTNGPPTGAQPLAFRGTLYYIRPGQLPRALFEAGLVQPQTDISWERQVDFDALTQQPLTLDERSP
jgi:hypothetical protein